MRCQPCKNLTISRLIAIAFEGFTPSSGFSDSNFYRHHPSIHALRHSARAGCELCSLLLGALWPHDDPLESNPYASAMSNIRVAIASSHHVMPDTVRMFDLLEVQADDPSGGRCGYMLLLSPAGTAVGQYQVGRDITDSRLSAPSNFAIMRRWLDQCTSKHQCCPDLQRDVILPTRVIDVGDDGAALTPFLLVSDGTARGRYAALTHCWGGNIDVVLTKDRLTGFQDRLPVQSLAKNFKDALYICRELGVRYLWIDCLCIVQDSEHDWAAESSKMTSVYSNAFVTISALASRGSSSGIFRDHYARGSDDWSLRQYRPEGLVERNPSLGVTIALDSSPERGETAYALQVEPAVDVDESLQWLHEHSPLTRRAWCLQESLLSPRIIFFGEEQVYWRCFDGFQSADGVPMGNQYEYPPDKDICLAYALQGFSERVGMGPPSDRRSNLYDRNGNVYARGGYHSLIREYSKRNLTKPTDKFPAFSALAERIHAGLGGEYLAGLFTTNLHSDLLWKPQDGRSWLKEMEGPESPDYIAPSWSWASAYGEVAFDEGFKWGHDTTPQQQLRLIDSKIRYRDQKNPYGQVLPGSSITVAGLATRLKWSKQIALGSEGSYGQRPKGVCVSHVHWDTLFEASVGEQFLFAVSSQVSEGETCAQQDRGFYVATSDLFEYNTGDWDFPQPEEGCSVVSILPEFFLEDELLMLVVVPEDLDTHTHAECLVLHKTDQDYDIGRHGQQVPVYRRVGTLTLSKFDKAVGWGEMTLEII